MLQSFFKENKVSLSKLVDSQLFGSDTPRNNKVCCQLFGSNEKVKEYQPIKSPNPKRRKIFEEFGSPQSTITAQFGTVSEDSEVQTYRLRSNEHHNQIERKAAKKKYKINKENGLCLVRSNQFLPKQKEFRSQQAIPAHQPFPTMPESEPTLGYRKVQQERGRRVQGMIQQNQKMGESYKNKHISVGRKQREIFEDSLVINDGVSDIFTFSDASSLNYSYSNANQSTRNIRQFPRGMYSPFQLNQ